MDHEVGGIGFDYLAGAGFANDVGLVGVLGNVVGGNMLLAKVGRDMHTRSQPSFADAMAEK